MGNYCKQDNWANSDSEWGASGLEKIFRVYMRTNKPGSNFGLGGGAYQQKRRESEHFRDNTICCLKCSSALVSNRL